MMLFPRGYSLQPSIVSYLVKPIAAELLLSAVDDGVTWHAVAERHGGEGNAERALLPFKRAVTKRSLRSVAGCVCSARDAQRRLKVRFLTAGGTPMVTAGLYGFGLDVASRLTRAISQAVSGTVSPLWQSTQTQTLFWLRLYTVSIRPSQIGQT